MSVRAVSPGLEDGTERMGNRKGALQREPKTVSWREDTALNCWRAANRAQLAEARDCHLM